MAAPKPKAKPKAKPDPNKKEPRDFTFVKAFLDDHPQVRRVVRQAAKEGWTSDRFQGALRETKWWRDTTKSQRQADVLSSEQPEEYQKQVNTMLGDLNRQVTAMGLTFNPAQLRSYATAAIRNGYTAAEITQYLGGHGSLHEENAGTAGVTESGIREMAASYGLKVSDATINRQIRAALSSGDPSGYLSSYQQTLSDQAKAMYPQIADWLDQGHTVRDRVGSYLEMAGSELGIDPASVDLTDPKWTRMLNGPDGAPMSQDQWMTTLRTDTKYGWAKTSGAKSQASDFANQLVSLMRGGVGV